jgi:Protein of unknown function (DUF2726)
MNGNMLTWLLLALALVACAWLLRALFRTRAANEVADPKKQLGFVSKVAFETRPLLNKSEFQVLLVLEEAVRALNAGHRVMAQTCYGEFLKLQTRERNEDTNRAYRSINSKRADFVIIDGAGYPVAVVEYQGTGHYQGTAELRDAVKREACRSAGVALIEVVAVFDKKGLSAEIRQTLQRGKRQAAS